MAREIVRPNVSFGLNDLAGKKAALEIANENFADEVLSYLEGEAGVEGSRKFPGRGHGNFGWWNSDIG
jgi:hypothetical protein